MFKKLLITTAICTVCSPAIAQTYHLMAPLLPAHQAEGDHLKVTLGSLKLPDAKVGYLYQVDLRPLVRATGTLHFDVNRVAWGIGGELPEGLTFANGIISGIPEEIGNKTVTVAATYKHATGTKNYTVPVTLAVALANAELPEIGYGQSPNFDFKPLLSIDDPSFDSSLVSWAVSPSTLGLAIDNGVLQGRLNAQSTQSIRVTASYKGAEASNTFELPTYATVTTVNGYRQWSDGSYASSCKEYLTPVDGARRYEGDTGDGAYMLSVAGSTFPAWCDMTTDGGGWTVFQRRFNGSVNFYRGIAEYRAGFGNVNGGEYWLGLININKLTSTPKEMRVDLGRYNGQRAYAAYRNMSIGGAPNYNMQSLAYVGGTAGDSMANGSLIGRGFSTYDYDIDLSPANCAAVYRGAWWYENCHASNLNGAWLNGPHSTYADGIEWHSWTGHYESLTFTEMKVR